MLKLTKFLWKNNFKITFYGHNVRWCSHLSQKEAKQSYFHNLGDTKLVYRTLGQQIKISSLKYGDREAFVSCHEKTRLTYSEMLEKVDRVAAGLLDIGLEKGDRVAIWAPNTTSWYLSMLGIARSGLISVGLNPAYQIPELKYCLDKVQAKAIICTEEFKTQKFYEMIAALTPELKASRSGMIYDNKSNSLQTVIVDTDNVLPGAIRWKDFIKAASEEEVTNIEILQDSISPDSACNIQFTSGTTGQPKAALLSHYNYVNNSYAIGKRHSLDKNVTRICTMVPLFHVYGVNVTICNAINHGAAVVLPSLSFNPHAVLQAIVEEKCNAIFGTPTMFVDLVAKQRELKLPLGDIHFVNTAGASTSAKQIKDIIEVLNVKKVKSVYGLTEGTSSLFQSLPDDKSETVLNSVGFVSDNLEVKVVDSEGNTVPFGQPGELCVRGYTTMLGYWDDEKKTKEILGNDQWLKTGDQFVLREDGYGQIVGRLKEMLIRGGENIFPKEIEDFLIHHPNILEVHVTGVPDERMGEEVGAFIRLKDPSISVTAEDLKKFCKGHLAHFKVPRYVVIVDDFPRTTSGKIQKFKFLELFADKLKL